MDGTKFKDSFSIENGENEKKDGLWMTFKSSWIS